MTLRPTFIVSGKLLKVLIVLSFYSFAQKLTILFSPGVLDVPVRRVLLLASLSLKRMEGWQGISLKSSTELARMSPASYKHRPCPAAVEGDVDADAVAVVTKQIAQMNRVYIRRETAICASVFVQYQIRKLFMYTSCLDQ